MSIKGKVKWFNPAKGYGFIEREDKEKDVFVHSSAAREANMELNEGDALTFEVENGEKRPFCSKSTKSLIAHNLLLQSKNFLLFCNND